MGVRTYPVKVIEVVREDGEYPMLYGKGRTKDDLVYFQLDATYLRTVVRKGKEIFVTEEEVVGIAEGHFKRP